MVARLPIEYQEVEYLESTGTQWIKTDIEGRFSASFESEIIFTGNQDSYSVGFKDGTFQLSGNGCYGVRTQIGYASSYSNGPSESLRLLKRYKYKTIFEPGNQEVYLDDVLVNTSAFAKNADTLTGVHFGIFARLNNDSSASLFSKVKMYYLKISDNGELLGHFIPCYRKSDSKPGMYDTVSGEFYVNQGTGEFLVGNNVYYDTTNLLESRRHILLTTPHLESPTPANPLTFKSNMTTKLKEGKVYFTPVQEGTGDPSPDNVRPISGWDGITVTKCGKNLLDTSQLRTGYYIDANGNENANSQFGYTTAYTPVKENTVYTLSGNIGNHGSAYGAVYCYNKNKEFIDRLGNFKTIDLPHTFTTPEGTAYVNIQYALFNNAPRNVQIELGSIATIYEPYKPIITLTIPFPQTIYGGYVDLVNGEVVEEWIRREMSAFGDIGGPSGSSKPWIHRFALKQWNSSLPGCDRVYGNAIRVYSDCIRSGSGLGKTNYTADDTTSNWYVYDDTISTVEEFKEKYANHYAVYKLNKKLVETYPIDPQVIRPLKGVNNIYSDANGNIEIKFWKH